MQEKKLFIVSNRLPLTIDENKKIHPSSGGLVTAIEAWINHNNIKSFSKIFWSGIPGCDTTTWTSAMQNTPGGKFDYLPVFIHSKKYNAYYNGHSNSVLWPLFHYFPSYADYNDDHYDQYLKVNEQFADVLLPYLSPEDFVWIHDYHLLHLANALRRRMPGLSIGFFLHIPFPSFEIFRLLPRAWQENLLQGLLGADLVGFHTIDYASHFLQSVLMVLGLDSERNIIHYDNRLIKVDVFPISIDFEKFNNSFDDVCVSSSRELLRQQMGGRKIIFSVDRLDYTKGVYNRLKAYEYFLQQNPSYHGKVVFIMVIVPSRDTIPKYADRKRSIDELISHINSKIGSIHWVPVIYQYTHLSFIEMLSLYTACDLALITPLRDGMNLVSKEFVASRKDKLGVLILSEMAGASRELTDALIINPNDVVEIAGKIKEGLEMPPEQQKQRLENMQRRISNYDVEAWAEDFMTELKNIKQKQQSFQIKFLDTYTRNTLFDKYRSSHRRLLLLDYDGTLVSFTANPEDAVPDAELLRLLQDLASVRGNEIFLISGRNSSWLEKHFGGLFINLIAEHGARYKIKSYEWTSDIQKHNEWKEQVHNIMEMYVRRCAGSFVEEKDFSIVWHYRNANVEQGKLRAAELNNELNDYIHNRHLQVLTGNKIVEVRHSGINKGTFIKKIIEHTHFDYVFAVGDDRTDEDMFKALIGFPNSFTIKVGPDASYALYNLHTPQMVVSILDGLRHLTPEVVIQ